MVKQRPVVVVSPKTLKRNRLVTVVPLSTRAPDPVQKFHHKLDPASLPPSLAQKRPGRSATCSIPYDSNAWTCPGEKEREANGLTTRIRSPRQISRPSTSRFWLGWAVSLGASVPSARACTSRTEPRGGGRSRRARTRRHGPGHRKHSWSRGAVPPVVQPPLSSAGWSRFTLLRICVFKIFRRCATPTCVTPQLHEGLFRLRSFLMLWNFRRPI